MRIIKSVAELKKLTKNRSREGFIVLTGGLKSSKQIEYHPETKRFFIYNFIDDTSQTLTEKELNTKSNIIKAINRRAFCCY